ncbi:hypothetical protein KDA_76610 [Dictyobacter alpinus]|uniref:Uncharacterized protein n=1 Tax=Dictyobacter alpinus TaxID=2014873 RepID=A0A402BLE7_9CHLR|nr:hypothetical protein [Dictyobacter alpinus]GCE32177.1 hypothetical protein KDA_76610 [Dictyobacter alpinus]
MHIDSVVLYSVTDPVDLREIEDVIKRDDEEAFALYGPYFKGQKGSAYLINIMDVGMGSDAQAYLQERYDPQGGIEITGTEDELRELESLFDSPDCQACRLGDRFLLLPSRALHADLVVCLMQRANGGGYRRQGCRLIKALRKGIIMLGWPYVYIRHCYQQEKHMRLLAWQSLVVVSLLQFVPILIGFLAGTILFGYPSTTGQHGAALLFAYLVGGLGIFLACQLSYERDTGEEQGDEDTEVTFEGFPLTDVALGFIIVSVVQLLIGRF